MAAHGPEATPAEFDDLCASLQEKHGFTADVGHLTVFGRCADCGPALTGSFRRIAALLLGGELAVIVWLVLNPSSATPTGAVLG